MSNPTTPHHAVETSSTQTAPTSLDNASRRQPPAAAPGASELARPVDASSFDITEAKNKVTSALQFHQDWPHPPVNFVDILPIFRDPATFTALLDWLEYEVQKQFPNDKPEVILGLEARGFLIGPPLALRLGASFVPARKPGKLPGAEENIVTAVYDKEYGKDKIQMQRDSVREGQKVLIVDDIIATGGTASAAAELVKAVNGQLLGFLFMIEIELPENDENGELKRDADGQIIVGKVGQKKLRDNGNEPILVLHTERD